MHSRADEQIGPGAHATHDAHFNRQVVVAEGGCYGNVDGPLLAGQYHLAPYFKRVVVAAAGSGIQGLCLPLVLFTVFAGVGVLFDKADDLARHIDARGFLDTAQAG